MPKQTPRGSGEWILLVDDEPAVRQITQKILEAFGYRVWIANDGVQALKVYAERSGEISLVITDMMMPLMDGPTTVQALRQINPAAVIIGASGLNANSGAANVNRFLSKPYSTEALLKTIYETLHPCPK